MIVHNFPNIPSMVLVDTSFKSYDFAPYNGDMPLWGKWNVLFHTIPKQLEMYIKLLEMVTLPSLGSKYIFYMI